MKISISYPPIETDKGIPLLSQNRQFQYFNNPTYIYPVIPAYAATMLKESGFTVSWLDGIAQNWSYSEYLSKLEEYSPDLLMIEASATNDNKGFLHLRLHLRESLNTRPPAASTD